MAVCGPPSHSDDHNHDDDDDDREDTLVFIHSVDEDENHNDDDDSTSQPASSHGSNDDDDDNDDDQDVEDLSSAKRNNFRRRHPNRGSSLLEGSYVSRSTAALESWVSSYARSSMYMAEAALPPAATAATTHDPVATEDPDVEALSDTPCIEITGPFAQYDDQDADETATVHHVGTDHPLNYGTMDDFSSKPAETAPPPDHHHHHHAGSQQPMSTFAQTCFNAVNVLMGIGILSLPFAFRITGWIVGGVLLTICCAMTHHTAGLLAFCLDYMPLRATDRPALQPLLTHSSATATRRANTYGDIGELAFGHRGRNFISVIFCLELTASSVALVILISDSVTAIIPSWHHAIVKAVAVAVMIPVTWPTSLKWASYGSLVGIVALVNLLVIIMYDGLSTTESPGSLLVPAETHLWPRDWNAVPLAIGLIMAGFCGHSVFPNIYRDMEQPAKYTKMLNSSYVITTVVYVSIAAAGYTMFGNSTMPEITQNLPTIPSYNRVLTHVTLWLMTINPMTKFPLNVNPVNVQLEHTLHTLFPQHLCYPLRFPHRALVRTATSATVLAIAVVFPTFHSIMSLMGSAFAFSVCVVFPSLCYLRLAGPRLGKWQRAREVVVLVLGVGLGAVGTVWALLY
ncbi:transmembrane amino acid transporter protein-domain-containing protein [Powellomyces hirtus]|nr:transmembrane amino acid transporter protein-domain-containing protein [Powellomyces hirtus]